jgi:hypothetical protein
MAAEAASGGTDEDRLAAILGSRLREFALPEVTKIAAEEAKKVKTFCLQNTARTAAAVREGVKALSRDLRLLSSRVDALEESPPVTNPVTNPDVDTNDVTDTNTDTDTDVNDVEETTLMGTTTPTPTAEEIAAAISTATATLTQHGRTVLLTPPVKFASLKADSYKDGTVLEASKADLAAMASGQAEELKKRDRKNMLIGGAVGAVVGIGVGVGATLAYQAKFGGEGATDANDGLKVVNG